MATATRDRLARTLRGDARSAFSVEMTAAMNDLRLEVEGFGRVKWPVTPAKARKLIALGRPARFGRGEETLTDPAVRDTWEIPTNLVRAQWDDAALKDILATVKDELGLPLGTTLTAELHSLLIYEPDQFFLAHQDSEKDDSMIGTLVVTLPSSYKGGELLVGHNGEQKAYQGSRWELSLVAFYADCRHEVLPVKSGYRVTLTYNLLLHGLTSRPEGDDGTTAELVNLLRDHFGTPAPRYYGGTATYPPNRLVYLLDHEYTSRGLTWPRLKGADTRRVSLLRAAADQAGCETVLALADIRTTHGASPVRDSFGHRDRSWYDRDYDDSEANDASAGEGDYDIHGLVDFQVALTHWTGPDGTRLTETSLHVGPSEVRASTPSDGLAPYSCEYEGYMGNWGNSLDRWYHRAAVIVWPREQAFANRAETSPAWALDELVAMASAGDVPGARGAAATLAPFWNTALSERWPQEQGSVLELFWPALRAAEAVSDAQIAAMLLHPFHVEDLGRKNINSFGKIAGKYGQPWTVELLRGWFGGHWAARAYGDGPGRPQWVAEQLPGLCARLRADGPVGAMVAQQLVDLAWEWIAQEARIGGAKDLEWLMAQWNAGARAQ